MASSTKRQRRLLVKWPALGVLVALTATLFLPNATPFRSGETVSAASSAQSVPGELLVGFARGVAPSSRAAAHQAAGADLVSTISQINVDHVRVRAGQTTDKALNAYRNRSDVLDVELN